MKEFYALIECLLKGEINAEDFMHKYFELYDSQTSTFGEPIAALLSSIYLDCDEFGNCPEFMKRMGTPQFSIDEKELRKRVSEKYKQIKEAWEEREKSD